LAGISSCAPAGAANVAQISAKQTTGTNRRRDGRRWDGEYTVGIDRTMTHGAKTARL